MSRLSPARPRGVDLVRRLTFIASRRMYGRTIAPIRMIAHHRPLLLGYGALSLAGERFARSVDGRLKELAMLRSAQLVGCEWCLDFGSRLARDSGVPEEQMRDLPRWRDSPRFAARERLVIEYAEAMTRTPVDVAEELFDRLRTEFDERQIVELTMAVAMENLYARSNWAFRLGSEGFSDGSYCVLATLDSADRRGEPTLVDTRLAR